MLLGALRDSRAGQIILTNSSVYQTISEFEINIII